MEKVGNVGKKAVKGAIICGWRLMLVTGAFNFVDDSLFNSQIKNNLNSNVNRILYKEPPDIIDQSSFPIVPRENFEGLIEESLNLYRRWEGLGGQLEQLLNNPDTKHFAETLESQRDTSILDGAHILQTARFFGEIEDKYLFDSDYSGLWINGDRFDLKNRYQKQLAGAIIHTQILELKEKQKNERSESKDNQDPWDVNKFTEEKEALVWLKSKGVNIRFEERSAGFYSRENIVTIAMFYQELEKASLPFPREVSYCDISCLDFVKPRENPYEKSNGIIQGVANVKTQSAKLEHNAGPFAFAHETGHILDGVNNLLERYALLTGQNGLAPLDKRFSFLRTYGMLDIKEDFADNFAQFIIDGEYFRDLILAFEAKDPENGMMLRKKYEFIRDEVFQGVEFSSNARRLNTNPEGPILANELISWYPHFGNVIEIKPGNSSSINFVERRIPVIRGKDVYQAIVGVSKGGKEDYLVFITNPDLLTQITFFPYVGDSKVTAKWTNPYRLILNEKGASQNLTLSSANIKQSDRIVNVLVTSISDPNQGEIILIFDNDEDFRGVPLRDEPKEISEGEVPLVYDGEVARIIEGPVDGFHPYVNSNQKYWKIMIGGITGWISDRWIGRQVAKSSKGN